MYSQYKDIQFELAYLSRIIKYLKPRIKNLKDKKEFYDNIIKNSLHPELTFCDDVDFEYDNYEDFSEDITNLSDKALECIAKIEDGWRKQNLDENYYNEKRPKVTLVTENS